MNVFAEIEHTARIAVQATAFRTPVWRYALWNFYEKQLRFMKDEDPDYPAKIIKVGSVYVDAEYYFKAATLSACFAEHKTFFVDGNTLYIHFVGHNPPYYFTLHTTGILSGFTDGEPAVIDCLEYLPDLVSYPQASVSADLLTYGKMKFNSGSVVINNAYGAADGILNVFGNNLNVLLRKNENELELLYQYYISSYKVSARQATFNVKDKRERLSVKCPNTYYDRDAPGGLYEFIEDNLINQPIQDAYGECDGVKAVCINGKQVYERDWAYDGTVEPEDRPWLEYHTFKAARDIREIYRVQVKMKDVNGGDLWVEVFPGLGVPGNDVEGVADPEDPTGIDRNYPYQTMNPKTIKIIQKNGIAANITGRPANPEFDIPAQGGNWSGLPPNDGMIMIWSYQALRANPGTLFSRGGEPQEVKIDGVFGDLRNPGDIAKDIIMRYGGLPDNESAVFNLEEWKSNLEKLPDIGIALDSEKTIYEWVEIIQNGCLLGWQMLVENDLFTARLDNPNRAETFNIPADLIANIHDVEVEIDGENYASWSAVKYRKDYADDEYLSEIDTSEKQAILDYYKFDKEYENEALFREQEYARLKGKLALENFKRPLPVIRNIELLGERWFGLKLYEIGYIDFTLELPAQLKALQPYMRDRDFMGKMRCQVIGKKIDPKNEKVIIDVRQRDRSSLLPLDFWEVADISGERPGTVLYQNNFDNMSYGAAVSEYDSIRDGGGPV